MRRTLLATRKPQIEKTFDADGLRPGWQVRQQRAEQRRPELATGGTGIPTELSKDRIDPLLSLRQIAVDMAICNEHSSEWIVVTT